ncbi:MAG: type B 50S ribosomal protein L31 [Planctomycetes bacterium]|nr:type B 50S ribosomal protein L31 [Planctomycetota bacterium]
MQEGIHPRYHLVVFRDEGANFELLTRSTLGSDKKIKWKDGNEYPLVYLDISSASHPFFTGTQKLVDAAGRIEKFNKRYRRG